jgi:hypothetical protein
VSFDACVISSGANNGVAVASSYWGVQGFEVDGSPSGGACFYALPYATTIHHIIFANDIANKCSVAGFGFANISSSAGVDYFAVVGSIAYNAAGGTANCNSGIDLLFPVNQDALPGTHIYVAGNFAWDNVDGLNCDSGAPATDGEGIIFDTWSSNSYSGQSVADNNILVYNGGRGLLVYSNTLAPVYFRHNTVYGNNTDIHQNSTLGDCGEIDLNMTVNTQAFLNIAQTNAPAAGCDVQTTYAWWMINGSGTNQVYENDGYDSLENNYAASSSPGFSYAPSNLFSTPALSNPVDPGPPNCAATASVPDCMKAAIANFKPTAVAAIGYGYQIPSTTSVYDPLFPQWLCNVNLPAGLVTMGCSSVTPPTGLTAVVN